MEQKSKLLIRICLQLDIKYCLYLSKIYQVNFQIILENIQKSSMTIKLWNKFYLGFLRHYMDIFYELDLFIFKLTFKRLMAGKLTEEKGNERFIFGKT